MNTCKVDNQGRIVTPSQWRADQGIRPGSELVILEEDGRLIVQTREQALREAQAIIRKYVPATTSLTADLMSARKSEIMMERSKIKSKKRVQGPR